MLGSKFEARNRTGSAYYISPQEIQRMGYTDINRLLSDVGGRIPTLAVVGATGRFAKALVGAMALHDDPWGEIRLLSPRMTTRTLPVRGIRTLRKQDLPHNGATPDITVDPETYVADLAAALTETQGEA